MDNFFWLIKTQLSRNSHIVQWLGHQASTVAGMGLIPDQGTQIPQARQHGLNK